MNRKEEPPFRECVVLAEPDEEDIEPDGEGLSYKGYICDPKDPEIEEALGYLLAENVLITGFFHPPSKQLRFLVLCNDVFCRAADAEELTDSREIFTVFHIYRNEGHAGLVEWIAKRRGVRPLPSYRPPATGSVYGPTLPGPRSANPPATMTTTPQELAITSRPVRETKTKGRL